MTMLNYTINPVKMGGLVKEIRGGNIKVHLHGRLGVITVPRELILSQEILSPGHETEFYFSYIRVTTDGFEYDSSGIRVYREFSPCLLGGTLTEVNDTAVRVEIMDNLGDITVPRRWVFTDVPLAVGLQAEFYFSCMRLVGKRDLPAEFI